MVAVKNSENALLVENDMRDNKQQRDSRCATWRKFFETKLYKFRFLFFSSTFVQEGKNGSVSLAEKRDSIVDWNSYG